jgi:hypothetical protein
MSFPPGTEMFQFPGFASATYEFSDGYPQKGWVAPFGYPRIKACSRLPEAYRSVPRPSSPLDAKASTRCPSLAQPRSRHKHKSPERQAYPCHITGIPLEKRNALAKGIPLEGCLPA